MDTTAAADAIGDGRPRTPRNSTEATEITNVEGPRKSRTPEATEVTETTTAEEGTEALSESTSVPGGTPGKMNRKPARQPALCATRCRVLTRGSSVHHHVAFGHVPRRGRHVPSAHAQLGRAGVLRTNDGSRLKIISPLRTSVPLCSLALACVTSGGFRGSGASAASWLPWPSDVVTSVDSVALRRLWLP
jgi:hypothetical protein